MTDHFDPKNVSNGSPHLEEERSVSPIFTPKGKQLTLPPMAVLEEDNLVSSEAALNMSPTPGLEASTRPAKLSGLTNTTPDSMDSVTAGQYTETFLRNTRQPFLDRPYTPDMNDSPIFNTSSPLHRQYQYEDYRASPQTRSSYVSSTDHSGRLSCSTMASSVPRAVSASNLSLQPDEYGVAFGSPRADKAKTGDDHVQEEMVEETAMRHVSVYQVGLGLMSKENASIEGEIGSVVQPLRVPFAVTVPPRATSRPRAESQASSSEGSSSKGSGGSPICTRRMAKKASFASTHSRVISDVNSDEMRASTPALSKIYTGSIKSVGRESMQSLSPISPRSSSLKKAKPRNRARSKASSQSSVKVKPPHLDLSNAQLKLDSSNGTGSIRYIHSASGSSGSTSLDSGEDSFDRDFFASLRASPQIDKRVSEQTAIPVTPLQDDARSLMDYLAYSAAGLTENDAQEESPSSPSEEIEANSPASSASTHAGEKDDRYEETKKTLASGEILKAEGQRLSEIAVDQVGLSTTHLNLSGSKDENINDYLEGILPLVGDTLLVLDLSNTRLSSMPKSLSCCTKLEELNVSSTNLGRLFHNDCTWAKRLGRLKIFTADHCSLLLVPTAIAEMKSLVKLSLQHNRLSHMPSWLHRLTHLETLLLMGNPFQGQWEKICRAFIMSVELPIASQATLDGNSASAPAMTGIELDPKASSFFNEQQNKKVDKHTPLRPFIRKMKSQGGDMSSLANTFASQSIQQRSEETSTSVGSASASSRRPSLVGAASMNVGEQGEKKWNLIRKMGRKSSTSQLSSMYASSIADDASIRERSNSLKGSLRRRPKIEVPAIPTAWQDTPLRSKQDAISDTESVETDQRSKLRGLMQYLQDLDDLGSAPTVMTPASELSMDLSMVSYTSSLPSKDMSRSDSETSRQSNNSDTSLSSQECLPTVHPIIKDDSQKRIHILQEILATEDSYIRTLQELVSIYVSPAAAFDSNTGHYLIPTAERKKVFANVEAILQFHQGALYPALRMVAEPIIDREEMDEEAWSALSAKISERVAAVMLKHAAFFRMYTAYVNGVNDAVIRVSQWRSSQKSGGADSFILEQNDVPALGSKEKKRIKAFLLMARSDSRHSQLSLETYLHLPVQRIPRYRLLLEDLARHCPAHRLSDPTILTRALESICSVATLMNESKRQSEKNRRLLEWQSRVKEDFPSPLVQPHRQLIKDGPLVLQRIVTRSSAFHVSPGHETSIQQPTDESQSGMAIQVDCLDQQSINKKVTVLLCNDITVVLTNEAPYASASTPVNLFAVLRIKDSVELIGEKSESIIYFEA